MIKSGMPLPSPLLTDPVYCMFLCIALILYFPDVCFCVHLFDLCRCIPHCGSCSVSAVRERERERCFAVVHKLLRFILLGDTRDYTQFVNI